MRVHVSQGSLGTVAKCDRSNRLDVSSATASAELSADRQAWQAVPKNKLCDVSRESGDATLASGECDVPCGNGDVTVASGGKSDVEK